MVIIVKVDLVVLVCFGHNISQRKGVYMNIKRVDQLEKFFIVETTKLLSLYADIRVSDPRSGAITGGDISVDEEMDIVKHSWASLVSYAKIYNYGRFEGVDIDLEKFYKEKINVQT